MEFYDNFIVIVTCAGGLITLITLKEKVWPKFLDKLRHKFIKPHDDLNTRCNDLEKEQTKTNDGVVALLYDRLYHLLQKHLDDGEIDVHDLENVDYLYKAYSGLNGNGTCQKLWEDVHDLPVKTRKNFIKGVVKNED